MRPVLSLIVCFGLSACATDYVSQLSQPNYGIRSLHYSLENVDPTMLMNGTYASKQLNGLYIRPSCPADYRCSQQAPSSSGWIP